MKVPADYEYIPRSLQYRPYTADNMYVRFESIGGQITLEAFEGVYGTEYDYVKETALTSARPAPSATRRTWTSCWKSTSSPARFPWCW